jgi:hypothetical protein
MFIITHKTHTKMCFYSTKSSTKHTMQISTIDFNLLFKWATTAPSTILAISESRAGCS